MACKCIQGIKDLYNKAVGTYFEGMDVKEDKDKVVVTLTGKRNTKAQSFILEVGKDKKGKSDTVIEVVTVYDIPWYQRLLISLLVLIALPFVFWYNIIKFIAKGEVGTKRKMFQVDKITDKVNSVLKSLKKLNK